MRYAQYKRHNTKGSAPASAQDTRLLHQCPSLSAKACNAAHLLLLKKLLEMC